MPGGRFRADWRLLIGRGYALLTLPRRRARHPTGTTRAKESAIPAKVFVGNLSFNTTKERLQEFLAPAGNIVEVFLPTDRATGRMRGFAFVEYQTESEAQACIEQFNEKELDGRNLRINSAEDRPRRPSGFSPGGGGGGGGYGGGGPGGGGGDPFFGGGRPFKSKGSRRNLRARKRGG
ncbi:MAG TPA: RNA-binding protein [Polyangia bacterium]|jgi:RNA recognition motif-containing protein